MIRAVFPLSSEDLAQGREMHALMARLFPIPRSLTGDGVRETLRILGEVVPLEVHEVPSGTRVFDWTVPDEWTIRDAFVADGSGTRVIDFRDHTLHVVGYSEPVDKELDLEELQPHLHSWEHLPEAIPYVTAYYSRAWGFCLSHKDRLALEPGRYRAKIDSTIAPGTLTYGELHIPGQTEEEILLSTYICHPSMANNELSGPVLTTFLARELLARKDTPRYGYRIVFVPETVGSLTYLSRHLDEMKQRTVAGYVVTCVGGPSAPTYLPSRRGDALVDRATRHVLDRTTDSYREAAYTERGSDERQYCAPGIDLPVGSLMRSKYHDYPEYHSSLDDLDFVRPEHMAASLGLYRECLRTIEANRRYRVTVLGEPQLGKRGLYPRLGGAAEIAKQTESLMALLGYSDGDHDLLDIAGLHGRSVGELAETAATLHRHGLLEEVP